MYQKDIISYGVQEKIAERLDQERREDVGYEAIDIDTI